VCVCVVCVRVGNAIEIVRERVKSAVSRCMEREKHTYTQRQRDRERERDERERERERGRETVMRARGRKTGA